jgi:AbrB family looped-hinge helix DNA binding protein
MILLALTMETRRLSTRGQIILPKAIRVSRDWRPGTTFTVEATGDGVLLRPAAQFSPTRLEDVAGCLKAKRQPKTSAQMGAAIGREVLRRHDRGRY